MNSEGAFFPTDPNKIRTVIRRYERAFSKPHHDDGRGKRFLLGPLYLLMGDTPVQNRDENFQLPIPMGKVCDPPFQEFKGDRCHYDYGFSLHAKVKSLSAAKLSGSSRCQMKR